MKYAVQLLYENGQVAYLEVKGRHTWKTRRAAKAHFEMAQQLMSRNHFLRGVVEVSLVRDFFV